MSPETPAHPRASFLCRNPLREEACLALEHRVDPHYKIAAFFVSTRKMPSDRLVSYGEKAAIGALCALNPAFVAQISTHSFAQAGW